MSKKPQIHPRKPPAAPTASMEQFVSGASDVIEPAGAPTSDEKTTVYTRRKGAKAGEKLRRVTLYFPAELHTRARIAAIRSNVPLSTLVIESLEKSLRSKG